MKRRLEKEALKTSGKVEFWILEEAAHGDDRFYQDEVLDRVIGFLRKTEKPDEVIW